ncbi:hypothetical protein EVAR_92459_1 [Eumeta japonica]|uniref:Uncharacterized protein n=1 Tax=Eumeta variegata TaxID=151549 RepID=A0A4C1T8T9_EUMVA|nr:hypothetical protein EVAR_92459_1 [Eumeta japonica]
MTDAAARAESTIWLFGLQPRARGLKGPQLTQGLLMEFPNSQLRYQTLKTNHGYSTRISTSPNTARLRCFIMEYQRLPSGSMIRPWKPIKLKAKSGYNATVEAIGASSGSAAEAHARWRRRAYFYECSR